MLSGYNYSMLALFDMPGIAEIAVILFVALLVFGGRLPDVARKLGRDVANLKKGFDGMKDEFQKGMNSAEQGVQQEVKEIEGSMNPDIRPGPQEYFPPPENPPGTSTDSNSNKPDPNRPEGPV